VLVIATAVVATAVALGLSLAVARVVAAGTAPRRARSTLVAVLGLLLVATVVTATWPAGS